MSSYQETSPAPRGTLFNLLRRLHFYIGLFIAPFIFIAALTGTLYVLTPQLEQAIYHDALTTRAQGEPQPLSAQVAAARAWAGQSVHIPRRVPGIRRGCSSLPLMRVPLSHARCLSIPIPCRSGEI